MNIYINKEHKTNDWIGERERGGVSITYFDNISNAVLFITKATPIQMIEQLLGSPVVGGGEQHNISRKSWNLSVFFQRNNLMDIQFSIINICYTNTAPILKTLMFSLLHEWKI